MGTSRKEGRPSSRTGITLPHLVRLQGAGTPTPPLPRPAPPTCRMFQNTGCMIQYWMPAPANAIMSPCRKPVMSMEPRDRMTPRRATDVKISFTE